MIGRALDLTLFLPWTMISFAATFLPDPFDNDVARRLLAD